MTERVEIDAALEGVSDPAAAKRAWDQFLASTVSTHFLECELRGYELLDVEGALTLTRIPDGRVVLPATNGGRGNDAARAILTQGVKNFASKAKL